jgi:hypothetical protein
MGYLTTFTVYNDGVDLVKENAQDFADKIYRSAIGHKTCDLPIGNHCNLVRVQKCRHADDHTAYVHMGNSVFEMNQYSDETKDLLKRNPEFFNKAIKFLESEVKGLKRLLREAEIKK